MPAAAKEEMLASPSAEKTFSLAAGLAAALDTREGANAARGKKTHQGIFLKNRTPRVSSTWGKWSGTHQDRSLAWSETVLGPTIYLYDGAKDIEEVDNSGNVLARYTQSKGIDKPLAQLRSGITSYYQQDGLGSVTSLSNSAGALAETYTYDSYGKTTASTGTLTNPFQYTGRELDSETTLLFNRARYFDPNAGRFLSQDPIRYRGGVNFYAYTRNNPVVRTDPFGYQGGCNAEQWAQSPNACAGPQDPNSPYQGPDGSWYNVPDPTPPVPDDGPTPSPNPPDPNKKCDQPADQLPPDQPPPPPPKHDCSTAWGETGFGGAGILTEVALLPLLPQIETTTGWGEGLEAWLARGHVYAGLGAVAAMPWVVYWQGLMDLSVCE